MVHRTISTPAMSIPTTILRMSDTASGAERLGFGFAETSVERSHFINDWVAGIALMNFNALDLWVWYSTFQDCNMGVTNNVPGIGGAGNYHVYYSNFEGSTTADLYDGQHRRFLSPRELFLRLEVVFRQWRRNQ